MNIEQRVAENVRALCLERKIPLSEVARHLGMERGNFHKMLSGGVKKVGTLVDIAEFLEVEPGDLMFNDYREVGHEIN